jgi:hypothetical protein
MQTRLAHYEFALYLMRYTDFNFAPIPVAQFFGFVREIPAPHDIALWLVRQFVNGVVNAIADSHAVMLKLLGAIPFERRLGLDQSRACLTKSLILLLHDHVCGIEAFLQKANAPVHCFILRYSLSYSLDGSAVLTANTEPD